MKKKEHLPLFGVGPLIVIFQVAVTVVGIALSCKGYFDFGKVAVINIPLKIIGTIFVVFGISLYLSANFKSKVFDNITENKLVTTGVYGIARNPIYSSFLLICTGAVCMVNNIVLLLAPVIGWVFMTIVLKLSEEKWLERLYGDEYIQYCKRVNRCIPWVARVQPSNFIESKKR